MAKNAKTPDGERFMTTVKLGPKSQIVIPKEVREMLNIAPGDSLILLADSNRGIAIQKQDIVIAIADAVFRGENAIPGESMEHQRIFADNIKKVSEEKGEK